MNPEPNLPTSVTLRSRLSRLSSGPKRKIIAKKVRAKGIISIQVDSCLPHEQSLVNLLIEGDSIYMDSLKFCLVHI